MGPQAEIEEPWGCGTEGRVLSGHGWGGLGLNLGV